MDNHLSGAHLKRTSKEYGVITNVPVLKVNLLVSFTSMAVTAIVLIYADSLTMTRSLAHIHHGYFLGLQGLLEKPYNVGFPYVCYDYHPLIKNCFESMEGQNRTR